MGRLRRRRSDDEDVGEGSEEGLEGYEGERLPVWRRAVVSVLVPADEEGQLLCRFLSRTTLGGEML